MQIYFTEEEKKYIVIDLKSNYGLKCRKDTPEAIKRSIDKKIESHKRWLNSGGVK